MNVFRLRLIALLLLICGLLRPVSTQAAPRVALAKQGKALQAVVVSKDASENAKQVAATLADYLRRITGATFEVQQGDGSQGLAVGLPSDFPAVDASVLKNPQTTEDYLLRSHEGGVWLLGASDLAVRHAAWDFLYRLGYRQYFPGEHWEVTPSQPTLAISVEAVERPDYLGRRIWYGYGAWDYAKEPYRLWCEKNRCVNGVELRTGHAYDGMLKRNKAAFEAHPEYLGLLDGERKSTKFCISNPGLRRLVVEDALRQIEADPSLESISVDPSDGGGWCECEQCAKIGSVTDRAITLANAVAQGVTQKHPGKYIGMYAYSQHSPPPSIKAHPQVVISIATAFINGGYTVDELFAGWSKKASILGVREYYSVNTWDRDMPGAARGGKIDYLRQTIPRFHEKSARFMSAESSDNWAPNGLGYFLAARMMWDVDEANRLEELQADFFENCFGEAKEPMIKFYALLDGDQKKPLSDDLLGRMYGRLAEARKLTANADIHHRLDDLTLYTRYVELWLDYSITKEASTRQAAFEKMIRHVYRMRETMMIHSLALYRDVDARDKVVAIPEGATFRVPEDRNPWKSEEPFTSQAIASMVREGIANRPLIGFEPKSFSRDLVPATPLKLTSEKTGSMGLYSRSPRVYYSWVNDPPATYHLQVKGGVIYTNRGETQIDLYPDAETEGKSVAHAEVPPTRTVEDVELTSKFPGLHRLEILAGGAASATWEEGPPMTIESSFERPARLHGRWTLYFYVPAGTKVVGGFAQSQGKVLNANGQVVHTFDRKPGYFTIPVASDQDGALWRFDHCAGSVMLMTTPPYLARNAAELLLPKEVVQGK